MSTTRISALGPQGDQSPPVWEPPDNEVPVGVPTAVVLARTEEVAVLWTGALVYSTGVAFDLVIATRSAMSDLHQLSMGGRRGEGLLLGVEFADGRRTRLDGDGAAVLHGRGGSGGGRTATQSYWLHPGPPPGPMTVVLRAPGLGFEETRTELDAGPLAAAVAGVQQLWPWTPLEEEDHCDTTQVDLPEGSWFRTG